MAQSLQADSPQRCTHCKLHHQIGMGRCIVCWGLVLQLSRKCQLMGEEGEEVVEEAEVVEETEEEEEEDVAEEDLIVCSLYLMPKNNIITL